MGQSSSSGGGGGGGGGGAADPLPDALTLGGLPTPALCVDMVAVEHNEAALTASLRDSSVRARPHVKSHKCPFFAQRQLRSPEVIGLSCATVDEAETVVQLAGAMDVLLTNEVVSRAALQRVADLCYLYGPEGGDCVDGPECGQSRLRFSMCVDSREGVEALAEACAAAGVVVGVVVELDVGQHRCGVHGAEAAANLAQFVTQHKSLRFVGLQGYQGACQHLRSTAERREVAESVAKQLREAVAVVAERGLECRLLTGGGTGSYELDREVGCLTEVQPGSYLFMDADYAANEEGFSRFRPALFVLATVISRCDGWFVLDAGLKSHSVESGLPLLPDLPREFVVRNGGDEHMVVDVPAALQGAAPAVGAKVRLLVGHVDPTFNMHSWAYLFRSVEGLPLERWKVPSRAKIMRSSRP